MHYQLWIPNARGQDPRMLEELGLADFIVGAEFMPEAKGPVEGPGVIIAWRRPGHALIGYQPDRQTWLPAVPREGLAGGRFWLGFWNDQPVTPQDLARAYPQPGHRVQLGDGREWLVPLAKELTADLKMQDDGTWRYEIQRRFHAFYLDYLRWITLFGEASEGTTYDFGEAADFVLQGLRINYRLLPEAVSHLRLFDTDNLKRSLFAILGAGS